MRAIGCRSTLLALWERGAPRHALDRSALLCALGAAGAAGRRDRRSAARRGHREPAAAARGEVRRTHPRAMSIASIAAQRLELIVCGRPICCSRCSSGSGATSRSRACAAGRRACATSPRSHASAMRTRGARSCSRAACSMPAASDAVGAVRDARLREIEDALEAADPNADLAFDVRCEACGHVGTAQLDAGDAAVGRDRCARARAARRGASCWRAAYGWTEREILALGAERRAAYLSMVARVKGLLHRLAARAAGATACRCGPMRACRSAATSLGSRRDGDRCACGALRSRRLSACRHAGCSGRIRRSRSTADRRYDAGADARSAGAAAAQRRTADDGPSAAPETRSRCTRHSVRDASPPSTRPNAAPSRTSSQLVDSTPADREHMPTLSRESTPSRRPVHAAPTPEAAALRRCGLRSTASRRC